MVDGELKPQEMADRAPSHEEYYLGHILGKQGQETQELLHELFDEQIVEVIDDSISVLLVVDLLQQVLVVVLPGYKVATSFVSSSGRGDRAGPSEFSPV